MVKMFRLLADEDSGDKEIRQLEWYPSKEILPSEDFLNAAALKENVSKMCFGEVNVQYLNRNCVLDSIEGDPDTDINIHEAERNHSDLVPAKYEGGLKIWECCKDLVTLMQENEEQIEGKMVLDLGCGAGLLGIVALHMSASVIHFQDYNEGVLKHWTIPNVVLNIGALGNTRFWSGDWEDFSDQTSELKYDFIFSSETLYNPDNQGKLYRLLQKKLKPEGIAYLAAKSYYFGVGGSTKQFAAMIQKDEKMSCISLWKSREGVQREILEVKWLTS